MPAKRKTPTEADRERVKSLSAFGIPQDSIARMMGISKPTLHRHYRNELDVGMDEANAAICQSLFQAARRGSVAAQCFWLKARMGWRETNRTEVTGADGMPLPTTTEMPNVVINFTKSQGRPEDNNK